MERKYIFEAGLNVFTSYKTIVSVEHLAKLSEYDNHQYHIYGVLSYNKLFFRKEKTKITSKGIMVCIFTIIDNKEVEYDLPILKIADGLDYSKVDIIMNYPYTFVTLSIKDKEFLKLHPEIVNTEVRVYAQDLFNISASSLID
ncbi:MAG: hypothetical protein IJY52_06590, partial [Anaerotignum sp.]|nr:hypothetical protein [Anaerotignum sp.]